MPSRRRPSPNPTTGGGLTGVKGSHERRWCKGHTEAKGHMDCQVETHEGEGTTKVKGPLR